MCRRLLIVVTAVLLCACNDKKKGAGPAAPPAPAAPPDAAPAPVVDPFTCPSPEALATVVRAAWKLPAEHKLELSCVPCKLPAPGFAVAAVVDGAESYGRWLVLAGADRRVVAQSEPASIAPWYRDEGGGLVNFAPVDFDGDGVDELTFSESMSHGGTRSGAYVVLRVEGGAIRQLHSVTTESGNDVGGAEDEKDEWACEVQVKTVPAEKGARLVVDGKVVSGKTDDCVLGRHEYELRAGAFVEVPGR